MRQIIEFGLSKLTNVNTDIGFNFTLFTLFIDDSL